MISGLHGISLLELVVPWALTAKHWSWVERQLIQSIPLGACSVYAITGRFPSTSDAKDETLNWPNHNSKHSFWERLVVNGHESCYTDQKRSVNNVGGRRKFCVCRQLTWPAPAHVRLMKVEPDQLYVAISACNFRSSSSSSSSSVCGFPRTVSTH